MKGFKKHTESITTVILFALAITLYATECINGPLFIGVVGAIATLYLGVIKFKVENDKIFKDLFYTFNERYDKEFLHLISTLNEDQEKRLSSDEKNLILNYFNLCAEEYLWYSRNRIPSRVWKAWRAGIIENLEITQIKEIFEKETSSGNQKTSYYGFIEELENVRHSDT